MIGSQIARGDDHYSFNDLVAEDNIIQFIINQTGSFPEFFECTRNTQNNTAYEKSTPFLFNSLCSCCFVCSPDDFDQMRLGI